MEYSTGYPQEAFCWLGEDSSRLGEKKL